MTGHNPNSGPLAAIRVLEVGGIGPLPFAGTMLSDMGADVVKVERVEDVSAAPSALGSAFARRGRAAIALDLKSNAGRHLFLEMVKKADVVLEGFRPGVMERMGLGPEECLKVRPELVYGRVTGWGRTGPLAEVAGHDLNYIALTGALHATGTETSGPVPPLNLIGDYAGGAMLLAYGVVCALHERQHSGLGQVVDATMLDGASYVMGNVFAKWQSGSWNDARASNSIDSGSYNYSVYETADGKYVSIAPIERKFRTVLWSLLGLDPSDQVAAPDELSKAAWKDSLTELFRTKTRDEWVDLLEGTDACFAPVLSLAEVFEHPQIVANGTFARDSEGGSIMQPAPTPRLSRSGTRPISPAPAPGQQTRALLAELGVGPEEIDQLTAAGVVAVHGG